MIEIDEYIDGDKFENLADIGFGDKYTKELTLDINRLKEFISNFNEDRLPLVYCDSDRVKTFFRLLNEFEYDFALISHNGDTTFVESDVNNRPNCVVKWFGQNINCKNDENIVTLPIGLERKHWSKVRYGIHGYKHNKIYEYSKKQFDKKHKLYINFNPNTNKDKRSWIVPYFKDKDFTYIRMGGIRGDLDLYFKDIMKSEFVLCPDGNGIDCHRNWEVLYLGGIPVLEYSENHKNFNNSLIVDSFKNLNMENLKPFKIKNTDILRFSYWEDKIKRYL